MEINSIQWKLLKEESLPMPGDLSPNRTLNRFCDIINCFSEEEAVLSLTDIATKIGLPMSTTHRFIKAMESYGILLHANGGRSYQLGYQLIRWGNIALASVDLRRIAIPVLEHLVKVTGETAVLSVLDGSTSIWIEMIESRHTIRLTSKIGQRLGLHAGASSKVLWAFQDPAEVERLFHSVELTPKLPNTITDIDAMHKELNTIRERGYATSFEETDPGAMGVAAPVYDHRGELVAGIGIVAPISRIPQDQVNQVVKPVLDAGQELSKCLGAGSVLKDRS